MVIARCAVTDEPSVQSADAAWLPVVALGVAAFVMVTTEFMPVGLLPAIAADLHQTEGRTGLMVTLPGLLAAASAPATIAFTGKLDRRLMLAGLLSLLALSNLVVFLSGTFELMLFGRALMGIAVGGFWTVGGSLGPRLQPAKAAKAGAVILSGVSMGMVAGVPAGALLGELVGWRWAFGMAGGIALLVLFLLLAVMPSLPARGHGGLRDVPGLLRLPEVRLGLAAILLLFGGHFLAYTFVTPILLQVNGMSSVMVGAMLLAYGVAAFVGNFFGGWVASRDVRSAMLATALLLSLPLILLAVFGRNLMVVFPLLMLWGVAFGMLPIAVQSWMFRAAPKQLEAVQALFVSLSQVAIGIGAFAGGMLMDHQGIASVIWTASMTALLTAALFWMGARNR